MQVHVALRPERRRARSSSRRRRRRSRGGRSPRGRPGSRSPRRARRAARPAALARLDVDRDLAERLDDPRRRPARVGEPIGVGARALTRATAAARRRRDAGADLLLQGQDSLDHGLRARRAAGHVDVDGDDLVDALEDRVVREHAAGGGAGAHRQHPLRLEHLLVELADRCRHAVRDAARDDHQVGLARRRADDLGAEAPDVVARRHERDHLHRAAREAEAERPDRVRRGPGERPSRASSSSRRSRSRVACSALAGAPRGTTSTRGPPSARCRRSRRRGARRTGPAR